MERENEKVKKITKEDLSDSYKYTHETESSFRDDSDYGNSEIFFLTEKQIQIILDHQELSDGNYFGVNRNGETFVKLRDGIVKIDERG